MPPRSPLPQRNGLDAAWVRTPNRVRAVPDGWPTMGDWLRAKLPPEAQPDRLLAEARFVYENGSAVDDADPYRPHTFVWFHRELRDEPEVPGSISIVHRDERIVVVDKPPFLSSIPRGRHVMQSVVVKMRAELGIPTLTPAHRLDRVTSGLLVLVTEPQWRGAYQSLFQWREVTKVYRAVARVDPALELPTTVENHIAKEPRVLQARVVPGAIPNALTRVELERELPDGRGIYRLSPATGRTHQLRVHLNGLGMPIEGDPLYPTVLDDNIDDFSTPLQLLASDLGFTDPVDGRERRFRSERTLPLPHEG